MIVAPIFLDSANNLTLVIGQVRGIVGQHVFFFKGGGWCWGRPFFCSLLIVLNKFIEIAKFVQNLFFFIWFLLCGSILVTQTFSKRVFRIC